MSMTAERELTPHLLLVEGDDAMRRRLQLLLTGQGYRVHAFARVAPALAEPSAIAASHLVIDHAQSGADGIEALRLLQSQGWNGRAVLVAAAATQPLRDAALAAGFDAMLVKPFRDADLLEALARRPPDET